MQKFWHIKVIITGDEIDKTLCCLVFKEMIDGGYVVMDWTGLTCNIEPGKGVGHKRNLDVDQNSEWRNNVQEALQVVEEVAAESRKALNGLRSRIPTSE